MIKAWIIVATLQGAAYQATPSTYVTLRDCEQVISVLQLTQRLANYKCKGAREWTKTRKD